MRKRMTKLMAAALFGLLGLPLGSLPPSTGNQTLPGYANPETSKDANPNLGFTPPNPWQPVSAKNPLLGGTVTEDPRVHASSSEAPAKK